MTLLGKRHLSDLVLGCDVSIQATIIHKRRNGRVELVFDGDPVGIVHSISENVVVTPMGISPNYRRRAQAAEGRAKDGGER